MPVIPGTQKAETRSPSSRPTLEKVRKTLSKNKQTKAKKG
jgi:hypothetical protein